MHQSLAGAVQAGWVEKIHVSLGLEHLLPTGSNATAAIKSWGNVQARIITLRNCLMPSSHSSLSEEGCH